MDEKQKFNCPPHLTLSNLVELQRSSAAAEAGQQAHGSGFAAFFTSLIDPTLTWDCIAWLKTITKLPILVKVMHQRTLSCFKGALGSKASSKMQGVLAPDDAKRAVKAGANGIIISNHGGRQLDGTPAPLDVLPLIARVVDGQVPLLVDGGIRRGSDVLKVCTCQGMPALD